jgi:hypothetical protein
VSTDAWWLRRPEPPAVVTDPDLPAAEHPDAQAAPADLHQGTTIVLVPEPDAVRSPAPGPSRYRRRAMIAAVAGGIALVTGSASATVLLARDGDRSGRRETAASPDVAPIDPAAVTATATSTQDPAGGTTYDAANTLDGDPATAWNSDGAATGRAARARPVSLTYTFTRPVELRAVVLRNGYQKVRRRAGKPPVDLYPANARVHRLRVVTDAGTWTWDLADQRAPQTLTAAAGRTASVRLEVVSVYSSTTYPDVAVSEVAFTALPSTS